MKRSFALVKILLAVIWLPLHSLGQGNLIFNNIDVIPGPSYITINSTLGNFNPANGPAGAFLGADYTASLYFLNGTVSDQAAFDSSNPIWFSPADVQFYGTTGFNFDGSGSFDRGTVYLSAASSTTVSIQVRAWFNGGGAYTSYDQALAAGQNVGESAPLAIFLAQGLSAPTILNGLLPFTVGIVPESSTFALFGLGGLGLWLLQRRK